MAQQKDQGETGLSLGTPSGGAALIALVLSVALSLGECRSDSPGGASANSRRPAPPPSYPSAPAPRFPEPPPQPPAPVEVAGYGCPQGCDVQPTDCYILGNISRDGERIYHVPGQQNYDDTQISPELGERWFCTEEEAVANGWRRARR